MRVEKEPQVRGTEEVKVVLDVLRPRIVSVLAQYQIPPPEGDDLLQEAVLATLQCWDRIENHEAWLLTVFRYRCSVYRRRLNCWRRLVQPVDPVELQTLAKPLDPPQEHQDVCRDVRRLLRVLSKEEILLLRLRYREDVGRKEVASRLHCHPANVSKVLRRILARLKAAAAPPLG